MDERNNKGLGLAAGLTREERHGLVSGFFCYVFWGLCPIFWKLLSEVDSLEIIAQRIIWCFATAVIACAIGKLGFKEMLREKRAWKYLVVSALLITVNWSLYIYAVNSGNVIETAIGYYINPIVSIVLGVFIFGERLTRLQGIALGLCVFGILFFTFNYGKFPWIAIALALSFGAYGAVKKKANYAATPALAFESMVMLVPSIIFAVVLAHLTGTHAFLGDTTSIHGWYITLLLVLAGPVTAVPLILFSNAAIKIPLSLLGFCST